MRNSLIALSLCAPGFAAQAEPLTLVALGDSLTQGYGLEQGQGFVPQLQAWLTAQGADVMVINAGVSGDTTAGGASRLEWTLSPEVDAIMVTLGGNDLLRGIAPAESRANLATILTGAKTRGLPILLIGMTAPGNFGPEYKAEFDRIYPELAAEFGTLLVPGFFDPLTGPGVVPDPALLAPYLQPDGIHPNAEGVARIVEGLGPTILALLTEAGAS